jgi:hypothetical protein
MTAIILIFRIVVPVNSCDRPLLRYDTPLLRYDTAFVLNPALRY